MKNSAKRSLIMWCLFSVLAAPPLCRSETTEIYLPLEGQATKQWLWFVKGNTSRLSSVVGVQEKNRLVFRPSDSLVGDAALVSALVSRADGRMNGSALRSPVGDDVASGTTELVGVRKEQLEREIAEHKSQVEALEAQVETSSKELRLKAGLNEVDEILMKAKELDLKIKALKAERNSTH